MLLHVPEALARCRASVEEADWSGDNLTAGSQSAQVKHNRPLPEGSDAARATRAIIVDALAKSALFFSGALPTKTFPPMFNRYDARMNAFGNHVDNAVRTSTTTGASSFFWVESMVRNDDQRRLLFDMDMTIIALRNADNADNAGNAAGSGKHDSDPVVRLIGCYHNLLRMWTDT